MADDAGTRTRRRRCTGRTLAVAALLALASAAPAAAANRLLTVDVATGSKEVLADERTSWAEGLCWRPDGRVAALRLGRGSAYVAYGPARAQQSLGPAGSLNHVMFAPSCARVAELGADLPGDETGALVRDVGGPPLLELRSYWPVEGPYMAWSADGALIADLDDTRARQAVRVTEVATGRTVARKRIGTYFGTLGDGAFSPDARAVVFAGDSGSGPISTAYSTITVFDVGAQTFRELRRLRGRHELGDLAWSPRGDRIAAVIDERIHLLDLQGRDLGIAARGANARNLVWSPDGAAIAFQRTRYLKPPRNPRSFPVRRWANDLAVAPAVPGSRARVLHRNVLDEGAAAWSPDGARLAVLDFRR